MNEPNLTPARLAAHTRAAFVRNVWWAVGLLAVSLAAGMSGYRLLAGMSWVDAFVNAAMILGGMGPVEELHNDSAKIFAGVYALYCGVVFIATAGLLILPAANHFLHKFHLDQKSDAE